MMTLEEKTDHVICALGYPGKMLSPTKAAPEGHTVFWNGNIFDAEGNKLWYGDVNLTKSREVLEKLASVVGTIYVTKEMPFRFDPPSVEQLESESDSARDYPLVRKFRG